MTSLIAHFTTLSRKDTQGKYMQIQLKFFSLNNAIKVPFPQFRQSSNSGV